MTRPISDLLAAQAVELRAAGLTWRTIAARLNLPRGTVRGVVARALGQKRKRNRPPTGRPRGRPPGTLNGANLYQRSLARAWRSCRTSPGRSGCR